MDLEVLPLGNTKCGGIAFPSAFTAHATVTSVSRSPDITAPTCLWPLLARTFCTVVTPVSSIFQISLAVKWCFLNYFYQIAEKLGNVGFIKACCPKVSSWLSQGKVWVPFQ